MTPDRYSLATYIGIPATILCVVIFLLLLIWAIRDEDAFEIVVFSIVGMLVTAVVFVLAWWPFDMSYHRWYKVDGEVTDVSSRILNNGDSGVNQRFVFVIDGKPYGVDDTRASLVHKGDQVHLKCKKEYVWNASAGWACNWNG